MASRKRPARPVQDDLFNEEVSLLLPPAPCDRGKVLGSPVGQLAVPASREACRLRRFSIRRVNGYEATLKSGEMLMIDFPGRRIPKASGLVPNSLKNCRCGRIDGRTKRGMSTMPAGGTVRILQAA